MPSMPRMNLGKINTSPTIRRGEEQEYELVGVVSIRLRCQQKNLPWIDGTTLLGRKRQKSRTGGWTGFDVQANTSKVASVY